MTTVEQEPKFPDTPKGVKKAMAKAGEDGDWRDYVDMEKQEDDLDEIFALYLIVSAIKSGSSSFDTDEIIRINAILINKGFSPLVRSVLPYSGSYEVDVPLKRQPSMSDEWIQRPA